MSNNSYARYRACLFILLARGAYALDPDIVQAARDQVMRCQERVQHMHMHGYKTQKYDLVCDNPARMKKIREQAMLDDELPYMMYQEENIL